MFSNGYKRIYHFHLKKCGGTTLNSWLEWHTPDSHLWSEPASDLYIAQCSDQLYEREFAITSAYASKIIHSHRALIDRMMPGTFSLTVVRDPVARVISQVADWRRESNAEHNTHPLLAQAIVAAGNYSLRDYLLKFGFGELRGFFENHQVRGLASTSNSPQWQVESSSQLLKLAMNAAATRFDLVGITERMIETRTLICSRLGLAPDSVDGVRKNVTGAANITGDEIEDAADVLRKMTELDHELYVYALDKFNSYERELSYSESDFERLHAEEAVDRLSTYRTNGDVIISVRDLLVATSIHGRDASGTPECNVWTGPAARSTIYLPVPPNLNLVLKIWIRGYVSDIVRSSLRFEVDDEPMIHRFSHADGFAEVAEIDVYSRRRFIKITILAKETMAHHLDSRKRGLAFGAYGWSVSADNIFKPTEELLMGKIENDVGDASYFESLSARLAVAPPETKTNVMVHLSYLAAKAKMTTEQLLSGMPFSVDEQVQLDAQKNIEAVFAADMVKDVAALEDSLEDGDSVYFTQLSSQLSNSSNDMKSKVMIHVNYLANKSGVSTELILAGTPFKVLGRVHAEAKKNIDSVLGRGHAGERTLCPDRYDRSTVDDIILLSEDNLEGWCSREKATAIANFIISEKPQTCVEIGVYGGRSLVPAAAALRHNGSGVIYGIETWRPDVATEYATTEINDAWWQKIDFHGIKTAFYRFIAEHNLASQVRVIEAPSADAAPLFRTIDYLHIDGAHSTYNAAEDAVLYAKKVRSGGIIVMDDANWPTTQPAIAILDSIGERLRSFKNDQGVVSCIIYRKH